MKIQVFIATHNRPDTFKRALDSILNQTDSDFELIVSDNSDNDETYNLIQTNYPPKRFKYIKREPVLGGIEHLNLIISEANGDYFMIFHDDDVMHNDYIERMKKYIYRLNHPIVLGCNAVIVTTKGKEKKQSPELKIVDSSQQMIDIYLKEDEYYPFPSFMYKTSSKRYLDAKKGGKYCDAALIATYALNDPVVLINELLIDYYVYLGQDSSLNDYSARMALVKAFIEMGYPRKNKNLLRYRVKCLCWELQSKLIRGHSAIPHFREIIKIILNVFPKWGLILLYKYIRS